MHASRVGLALVVVLFLHTGQLFAQQTSFSAAEQELWTLDERFWAALTANDLQGFSDLLADDMRVWRSSEGPIEGKQEMLAAVARNMKARKPGTARWEPEPLSVAVYGDIGINIARVFTVTVDGKRADSPPLRTTHIYQRRAAGWKLIGGMSASAQQSPPK